MTANTEDPVMNREEHEAIEFVENLKGRRLYWTRYGIDISFLSIFSEIVSYSRYRTEIG